MRTFYALSFFWLDGFAVPALVVEPVETQCKYPQGKPKSINPTLYTKRSMRQLIVKLGHVQSVIVITIFSCLASVSTARLIAYFYSWFGIQISSNIIISTLVPIILTPPISWYIIGLLLKIDQLEVEMRKAATFDPLTGLFSRRAFSPQVHP